MQESLFTVAKLDDFVPADHPLRSIRTLVNEALGRLNSLFNMIYADRGRDSIAPEKLMRALLLQVFYSMRMLDCVPGTHSKTVGADKAYDTADFVAACRQRKVTPHVAQNDGRRGGSAIDGRTTRHDGYRISQIIRKRIEEHFGWGKTVGRIRQTVFRGLRRVDQQFKLTMTASNLTRMARILFAVPHEVRQ